MSIRTKRSRIHIPYLNYFVRWRKVFLFRRSKHVPTTTNVLRHVKHKRLFKYFYTRYKYYINISNSFFIRFHFLDYRAKHISFFKTFKVVRGRKPKQHKRYRKKNRYTFHKTFRFDLWFKYRIDMYDLVRILPKFFTIHDSASYPFNGCRRVKHY